MLLFCYSEIVVATVVFVVVVVVNALIAVVAAGTFESTVILYTPKP